MNGYRPRLPLFLQGQKLSELVGVSDPDERRFHVCGGVSAKKPERHAEPKPDPWVAVQRQAIRQKAAGREPHRRVALVCDAGLGKTTNLEWLRAAISQERSVCQVPFLLRLDGPDVKQLQQEHDGPGALLGWMAALVSQAVRGEKDAHKRTLATLARMQTQGRITLLLDGLDHALSEPGVVQKLSRVLDSVQWRDCPVWVSGRPHAIDGAWSGLFDGDEWHFLRVEPLGEAEVRRYLSHQAGGDWYDEIAAEGRSVLAVPRLLRLTAGIIGGTVRTALARGQDPREAVKALELRTAADVYHLAYFTPGEWVDPNRLAGTGG